MNPTPSRTPLLTAVAVGALALSAFNTLHLSTLSAPAGIAVATLPQVAVASPMGYGDTTVPAASTVQFPADDSPAAPTF